MESRNEEKPLDVLNRRVLTLTDQLAEVQKAKSDIIAREARDEEMIRSNYLDLSKALKRSEEFALKFAEKQYAQTLFSVTAAEMDIEQSIKDAQQLKMKFESTDIPATNFEIKIDTSNVKRLISKLYPVITASNEPTLLLEIKEETGARRQSMLQQINSPNLNENSVRKERSSVSRNSIIVSDTLYIAHEETVNTSNDIQDDLNSRESMVADGDSLITRPLKRNYAQHLDSSSNDDEPAPQHVVKRLNFSEESGNNKTVKPAPLKVRDFVVCKKCHFPRCVYSAKKLDKIQAWRWSREKKIVNASYVCGKLLPFPEDSDLNGILVPESKTSCGEKINGHYFSSTVNFPIVCYVCASNKNVLMVSVEAMAAFVSYHPVCEKCKANNKEPRVERKLHKFSLVP